MKKKAMLSQPMAGKTEQEIKDIVISRNGSKFSIRLDTTCQNATGRYLIFRSDGMVYDSWETDRGIWIGGNNNE